MTGAAFGVYRPNTPAANRYEAHLAKPSTAGVFNENYRAELVAIHAALEHAQNPNESTAMHIYTDSLASIHSISKAVFYPQLAKRKLHAQLVMAIANIIIGRAKNGLHTHLHKVKAHAGIEGNENADVAAKQACTLSAQGHNFESHRDYSERLQTVPGFWTSVLSPDPGRPPAPALLRNPRKDIAGHLQGSALELYPPTTTYAKGLVAEIPEVSIKHRALSWATNISDSQQRTVIRTLAGQILNFKLIHQYTRGRVPALCPLCRQPDSTSHIVCGGCSHVSMVSRVIQRHDNAVRLILPAILQGAKGAHAILADVNVPDDDTDDADTAPVVHGLSQVPKRLPRHLLHALHRKLVRALKCVVALRQDDTSPEATLCRLMHQQYGRHDETYARFRLRFDPATVSFRPDIALFEGGTVNNSRWEHPIGRATLVLNTSTFSRLDTHVKGLRCRNSAINACSMHCSKPS